MVTAVATVSVEKTAFAQTRFSCWVNVREILVMLPDRDSADGARDPIRGADVRAFFQGRVAFAALVRAHRRGVAIAPVMGAELMRHTSDEAVIARIATGRSTSSRTTSTASLIGSAKSSSWAPRSGLD